MKWFSNDCAHHRQKICLQAGGVLPEAERFEVESHLAACVDCQKYSAEMKSLVVPLANWEKHFARITPSQAQQMRWEKAIKVAGKSKPTHSVSPGLVLRILWNELIWPVRRIWAGLAAAWLFIVIANLNLSGGQPAAMAKDARPAAAMFLAWREQERMLAELVGRTEPNVAEPPKQPAPQPRSERSHRWATA